MSDFSSPALEIWQGWALVLAVLTFYVVIGLYIENSCVVERSPQNCLPIPKDVFECILEQRPMLEKNYEEDGDGEALTKEEESKCWEAFSAFDKDSSGYIDANELRIVLEMMGQKTTEEEIFRMIAEADAENTGRITYA